MARLVAAGVAFLLVLCFAVSLAALGASQPTLAAAGGFEPGVQVGLDAEQLHQAAIALTEAGQLKAPPLAVLGMVVSALGESGFRVVPNRGGSGYCGVFQAHPRNIACDATRLQAHHFLKGGLGFQAGGAMHLAHSRPDLTPGAIATMVEASGQPAAFYDQHRAHAEQIIAAWHAGGGKFPASETLDRASTRDVLASPGLVLTPGQRADITRGLDTRLLATLAWVGRRYRQVVVTAIRDDHAPGTNHEAGRAADIGAVNGQTCDGTYNNPCARMVRDLASMKGTMRSTELIYCWDPDGPDNPFGFARADHCDHAHVGWDGP